DPDAMMCQNMNNCGPDGITVSDVLSDHKSYNLNTVMAAGNLPSVINAVVDKTESTRNTWLVTPGENPNTGNAILTKAKAFTAFLSGYRSFEIRFISATDYELWYHHDPQSPWIKDNSHTGRIGRDDVFTEAKAFILGNWWGSGQAEIGDTFRFCADPNKDIVEVPVLFWDDGGATAFTSDCVNALVNGTHVFTPETYGPVVNYSGAGASGILHDYVSAAFGLCNYGLIDLVDARYYHNRCGSVHCATNAIRNIPEISWWL
ncbi:MAG: protein-arginine deiminase domain-containing protein, partial [Pirellulales bacterium]|nr:protein-arginine deiminase domain-containing protein [Pirellulales bacterium]